MKRRKYLKLGTLGIGAFAGCTGQSGSSTSTSPPQTATQSPTSTPTVSATPTETESPTATETDTPTETPRQKPDTIFVDSSVAEGGAGTKDDPMARIQNAVEEAEAGQTIRVSSGEYREKISTVRDGKPDAPITITGPPDAVIRGSRSDYGIVRIHHSHIHLSGFTIEGLLKPGKSDQLSSYVDGQLIQTRPPHSTDEYLTNIVIAPQRIGYSRKSLIGLERTKNAEIGPLQVTGLAGADYLVGDESDHNGELLYIGTSPSNLGTDWHPWEEFDKTNNVHIHHVDASGGHGHAEFVDLKPGTHHCTVEYCTSAGGGETADDTTPTALSHNGHHNIVRWNEIYDCPIAVEFDADYPDWTYKNDLYGNSFHDLEQFALFIEDPETVSIDDQRTVCGNQVDQDVPDKYGKKQMVADCSSDVPVGNGVGHQGGDSPWSG